MIAIRSATAADVPLILQFIRDLAAYEKLLPEVEATEERLRATLFPAAGRPVRGMPARVLAGPSPPASRFSSTTTQPFSRSPASTSRICS